MSRRRSTILFLAICACAVSLFAYWHSRLADKQVVAWVERNGIQIGRFKAGQIDDNMDFELWLADGRAIPDLESRLLGLLERVDGERTPVVEPILIVYALGDVGTSKSVPVLADIAKGHGWAWMRGTAITSLRGIGTPECRSPLAYCLIYDYSESNRLTAADSLARIGDATYLETFDMAIERARRELERFEHYRAELQNRLDASGSSVSTNESTTEPAKTQAEDAGRDE